MIRYFLGVGDRAGSAVITEGLPFVSCCNPPPCVHISTLYMKTYCTACKKEGFIAPKGPRRAGTAPNGKQWARSGDINVCGCNPPPVFHAERSMKIIFTSQELTALMGKGAGAAAHESTVDQFDQQFILKDGNDRALPKTYYTVRLPSGVFVHGVTDSQGRTARYKTDGASTIRVYLGHKQET
jgi:hypothetical protein